MKIHLYLYADNYEKLGFEEVNSIEKAEECLGRFEKHWQEKIQKEETQKILNNDLAILDPEEEKREGKGQDDL